MNVVADRTVTVTLWRCPQLGTWEGFAMRLRYLGKTASSAIGDCPALYATDRGTFVVQGKIVTDPQAIADLRDLGTDESYVEVPADVLRLADHA